MDGLNDKKRKRIISWLFSKKYREQRKREEEEKKKEETLIAIRNKELEEQEPEKEKNQPVDINEKKNEVKKPENKIPTKQPTTNDFEKKEKQQPLQPTTVPPPIVIKEKKPETKEIKQPKEPEKKELEPFQQQPALPDVKPVDTIKEPTPPIIKPKEKEIDKEEVKTLPQEVIEETTQEITTPNLLQIAVIEEIDKVIKNDISELRDIKYQVEVLNQKEKDEVLIGNIERLQKQLDDLLKRFYEIKRKYEKAYNNISLSDITNINNIDIGYLINDYISIKKDNKIEDNILTQIAEVQEFIEIIDNIILIEKEKDALDNKFNDKLTKFNIRDEEFIKLQDSYTDIEKINNNIIKYNCEIDSVIKDINAKLANNTDVTKRIETITSIVPDSNRLMKATVLMASREFIPPTPLGLLFKATLFVSATNMLVSAFVPKTEEREVTKITVKNYSKDIIVNQDIINGVITDIDQALQQIDYMKKTFTTEFSQYQGQIPEYNTLIENIFTIEKNLKVQQILAYSYDEKMANALSENNEKVKLLENDNN